MSTKQIDALRLALEALERHAELGLLAGATITAIREALAEQPAQQQEPVYFCDYGYEGWGKVDAAMAAANLADGMTVEAYYTSPLASKPWVGLTQEDMYEIGEFKNTHGYVPTGFERLAAAIEAKLREKNTPQQSKGDA